MLTKIHSTGGRSARALVALAALAALAACGGGKRPPAVSQGNMRSAPPDRATPPPSTDVAVDAGPDVAPLSDDTARADDFTVSDPTGEGGPLADVHFGYDQAVLSDEGRSVLEKHAVWLQSHRSARIVVEGHCDERGTVDYNLALGDQRARAARDYLVNLGVAAERLSVVSFGKERPLDPASNEEAWAKNRRAHFVVSR